MKIILKNVNVKKIYDSAQCFTITVSGEEYWFYSIGRACAVKQLGKDCELFCKTSDKDFWLKFFSVDIDFEKVRSIYKDVYYELTTDLVLEASEGLIILQQEYFPCLISFITSQRKTVSAIRTAISEFCRVYGDYHTVSELLDPYDSILQTTRLLGLYTFPSLEKVRYNVSISTLSGLGFGYRSTYIYKATQNFIELSEFEGLPSNKVVNKLMQYFGVGVKIANCVALYSLGCFDVYPRDVWILRFEEEYCGGLFDETYCDGYAGIIQVWQYYYMLKVVQENGKY